MARLHEFKPLITAWIILTLITCFASSMFVVLPLIRSSHPVLPHGIINPRYGAVPLDRRQTEWRRGKTLRRRR